MLREAFEFPPDERRSLARARRLEGVTIVALCCVAALMYLVMGNSEAMKAAWLEDMISLVPPVVFLICSKLQLRPPDRRFPFGRLRVMNVAFAVASASLVALGGFLLFESVRTLLLREHPTIGGVTILGETVWLGWLMMGVLAVSAVPPVILGRMKIKAAAELHEKTLHADAAMNKADWTTALVGMVGVLGIGLGLWWADAAAAAFISIEILRDGWRHLRRSLDDACDHRATVVGSDRPDPLARRVQEAVSGLDGVIAVDARLCSEGMALSGDVFVVLTPEARQAGPAVLRAIEETARRTHWRVYDVRARPVERIVERFL
jgi:cation diffusion facilitator family transporter